MKIPNAAITNGGGDPLIERDTPRHEGRPGAISDNCYPLFIDVVALRQVIHATANGCFEIRTADDLIKL